MFPLNNFYFKSIIKPCSFILIIYLTLIQFYMLKYYILIILLIILFITHYSYNLHSNSEYTILQLSKPTPTILENNLLKKLPTIITDEVDTWQDFQNFHIDDLTKNNTEIKLQSSIVEQQNTKLENISLNKFIEWLQKIKDNKENIYCYDSLIFDNHPLFSNINEYTTKISSPTNIKNEYKLIIGPSNTKHGLYTNKKYRHFIVQLQGTRKLYLFCPDELKYLYPSDKYHPDGYTSQVNFWNINKKKFPDFNKAKYIEILLKPKQILYIPSHWWYASENIDTNVSIYINSEPAINYLLKSNEHIISFLHNSGFYKQNNSIQFSSE